MGFLSRFFGRAELRGDQPLQNSMFEPAPVTIVVEPNRPYIHKPALNYAGLRKGMWVETSGGTVGVLTGCDPDGTVHVTVAKPDGTTQMTLDGDDKAVPLVILSNVEFITQASIEDIPASRRGNIDRLRAMGYKNRSKA